MFSFRIDKYDGETEKMLRKFSEMEISHILHVFGEKTVAALSAATPKDTGKTSTSWAYKISNSSGKNAIEIFNSNVNDGVNIAVIIQLGHGTGTGGYVAGVDYINPAIDQVFIEIIDTITKELLNG